MTASDKIDGLPEESLRFSLIQVAPNISQATLNIARRLNLSLNRYNLMKKIMFSFTKKTLLIFSLASVLLLTACAGPRGIPHGGGRHVIPHGGNGNLLPALIIGGIIGGVIGHELGSEQRTVTATVVGTEVGVSVGGNIGRHMNEMDRIYVARSLDTVRTDVVSSWYNPDTGYEFKVLATRTFIFNDATCRDYSVEATIGSKTEQIFDTACRQRDGSWKVKNS